MVTRRTPVRDQGTQGFRSVAAMTAATLALLGGVAVWAVWQVRQDAATRPAPTAHIAARSTATAGAAPATAVRARAILTVDSVDQAAEAYSRFVEHMRVMDGYDSVEVAVVIAAGSPAGLAERPPVRD